MEKGHCGRVGGSWPGPALNETPCLSRGVALEPNSYSRYNEDWRGLKSFGDLLCPGAVHPSLFFVLAFVRDHIREWCVTGGLRNR